jgi:MarR family 2-MHQ and catechol resistance regulon transcriptional repressor
VGTHYDGSEREEVALDAFIKLMRASSSVGLEMNSHLDEWGLTTSQFGILEAVYHLGPMHQKEIGDKLLKSGGNITVVVNNLEDRDLVTRERMESDRRYVEIHLTEQGRELISNVMPQHVERIVERFDVLTIDEQRQLGELLRKLGCGPVDEASEADE